MDEDEPFVTSVKAEMDDYQEYSPKCYGDESLDQDIDPLEDIPSEKLEEETSQPLDDDSDVETLQGADSDTEPYEQGDFMGVLLKQEIQGSVNTDETNPGTGPSYEDSLLFQKEADLNEGSPEVSVKQEILAYSPHVEDELAYSPHVEDDDGVSQSDEDMVDEYHSEDECIDTDTSSMRDSEDESALQSYLTWSENEEEVKPLEFQHDSSGCSDTDTEPQTEKYTDVPGSLVDSGAIGGSGIITKGDNGMHYRQINRGEYTETKLLTDSDAIERYGIITKDDNGMHYRQINRGEYTETKLLTDSDAIERYGIITKNDNGMHYRQINRGEYTETKLLTDSDAVQGYGIITKTNNGMHFFHINHGEFMETKLLKDYESNKAEIIMEHAGLNIIQVNNGVWSVIPLPKGTRFGPYPDEPCQSQATNWISSFTRSCEKMQCNIEVIRFQDQVFYKTMTDIPCDTELVLFESETSNATNSGKSKTKHSTKHSHKASQIATRMLGTKYYICQKCGKSFTKIQLQKHNCFPLLLPVTKPDQCGVCQKRFSTHKEFRSHIRLHRKEKYYICEECGVTFSRSVSLVLHEKAAHKFHRCALCNKVFFTQSQLDVHESTEHITQYEKATLKFHRCALCNKAFSTRSQLKVHKSIEHISQRDGKKRAKVGCEKKLNSPLPKEPTNNRFEGGISSPDVHKSAAHISQRDGKKRAKVGCERKLNSPLPKQPATDRFEGGISSPDDQESHSVKHTEEEKTNDCEECDKQFTDVSQLENHKIIHSEIYKCEQCDEIFQSYHGLQIHQSRHHGIHRCLECGRIFNELNLLKDHMSIHSSEKPYICEICGKIFSEYEGIYIHTVNHGKFYKCSKCGEIFVHRYQRRNHELEHTGEWPFRCDECGKTFTRINYLRSHKLNHSGVWPHTCQECGKGFNLPSDLKYHMALHTGNKSCICDMCGKAFAKQTQLTSHIKVHTKPHKCTQCDKAYTHRFQLKEHQLSHTGEKPIIQCDECGNTFANQRNLNVHKLLHVGNKTVRKSKKK